MKLSVILPVFNEEKNLPTLYKNLKVTLSSLSRSHEIIFVNDGSQDSSLHLLKKLRKKDRKVKIINFSRNFGHMPAIDAGLSLATGQKVVIMDADLQDPPSIIPKLYSKAKKYEVVYAIKTNRKESITKKLMFSLFYYIIDKISPISLPRGAGTFSILDKKVVKILNTLPESNKYISGLRTWAGFSQASVTYERAARKTGKSKSITKLTKLALDGLISFSHLPLRIASLLGFVFAIVAFVFIFVVFVLKIFFQAGLVGWASTMSAILLIGGVQLITMGIIGEYLARIYDEVKRRPEYIISERIGFKKR